MSRVLPALVCGLLLSSACVAEPADTANGWRGNGTGLWPEAKPPLEWYRIPKGVIADLRTRPDRPGEKVIDGAPLEKGMVRDWLVVGPFPMQDSVKEFNKAQFADETTVQPNAGDKVGDLSWKAMAVPLDDRWAFGPATPPIADLATVIEKAKPNQAAYAHTYLYSPKGGTIRAVVDHTHGMKAWLNGKEVYESAERHAPLGSYYPFSKVEFGTDTVQPSPRFDLDLKPGWNRLLLKLTSFIREDPGWNRQTFLLRLMDLPTVPYESKNILWMTELPQRGNASPIVVGNRLFVMAEPDELLCIDKDTGKILWTAANNYYEMLTPEERQANPAFKEKIEPLLASLKQESDFVKRLGLRTQIQKTLQEIDFARFAWKADDHFQAHFGIVGFTSPSPLSDGKHVWVWCGNGVAACYDLEGKRQWISRVEAKNLSYSSSPALADGTFGVYLGKLIGLDARTGKVRWEQRQIDLNSGALLAARIAGVPVFISSIGHVVRASDGKILYRERNREGGASSWAPGVILGDVICLPRATPARPRFRRGDRRCVGTEAVRSKRSGWRTALAGRQKPGPIDGRLAAGDRRHGVHRGHLFDALRLRPQGEETVVSSGYGTQRPVPFLGGDGGGSLWLKPGRTYAEAGRNLLAEGSAGTPAFAGGSMYLRAGAHLHAIGDK